MKPSTLVAFAAVVTAICGLAQQPFVFVPEPDGVTWTDNNCSLFKAKRGKWRPIFKARQQEGGSPAALATTQVSRMRGAATGARAATVTDPSTLPAIDKWIFTALNDAGVQPTALTNDYEFIRRVSLDLTGRVPAAERVQAFVADTGANKREALVDELLAKPEWVDKWTMYFGDLLKIVSSTSQIRRSPQGVKAFNNWLRSALTSERPYHLMASDMIVATGDNSFNQGEINFVLGGFVTGGPVQDIWDQQTANIATAFLGVGDINCLLCHNGRGHLDSLSLWGGRQTRFTAWQLAGFLSHTETRKIFIDPPASFYWSLLDNTRYRADYALNTTTGNRPARNPVGTITTVAPVYIFNGNSPRAGEGYRAALAREVTNDPQFARAAVNYIWKEFFGVGLVDPPDQFDLARLDPDNPPAEPWTLQASHPRLLNALAADFRASGFRLKALMRQIVTSQAYQLSSYHEGEWKPEWDKLFARKLVRRLWAEEVHDAIAQTSGIVPSYNLAPGYGYSVSWAMQFPETRNTPNAAQPISAFLDAFLRGNRDDQLRRDDGGIAQALNLMNDNYVMNRIRATAAGGLLQRSITLPDEELVNTLFLTVLSRVPSAAEKQAALAALRQGNRTQEAENLYWSLYNKVDFVFNY